MFAKIKAADGSTHSIENGDIIKVSESSTEAARMDSLPDQNGAFITPDQNGAFITPDQNGAFITPDQNGAFITPDQNGAFIQP